MAVREQTSDFLLREQTLVDANTSAQMQTARSYTPLWLIAVALLGYILWIGTAIYYWFTRSNINTIEKVKPLPTPLSQPSLKKLLNIQKAGDVKAFYNELNNYAVQITKQDTGAIDELCRRINNSQLSTEVIQLQAQLYGNKAKNSDLGAIIKILESEQAQASNSQQTVLKDLYS